MKTHLLNIRWAWALGIALAMAGLAGCSGVQANPRGTAALRDTSAVRGRDLGRGGATSGGISSLDMAGNAADYSVYDARLMEH